MSVIVGPDGRKRIEFTAKHPAEQLWVQADGAWGPEVSAAQFVARGTSTQAERLRLRQAMQRLAGGPVEMATLERQERELAELLDKEPRETREHPLLLDAEGVPMVDAEGVPRLIDEELWTRMIRGFRFYGNSDLAIAYRETHATLDRVGFLAIWETSILEAPAALRSLADSMIDDNVLDALQATLNTELDGLQMGNGQSLTS